MSEKKEEYKSDVESPSFTFVLLRSAWVFKYDGTVDADVMNLKQFSEGDEEKEGGMVPGKRSWNVNVWKVCAI